MPAPLPPLNWLRAFEAAARHLSFTSAATELNMTQSAVSQQIKALEGHLGHALFHRRHRRLELTRTGLVYLPVVRDAFRTLSLGTEAITGPREKTLQVFSNLSFATFWLAPRLARFHARHPDILLNITVELDEPDKGLATGVDVEIRYSVRPYEGVVAQKLCQDWVYPVAHPDWTGTIDDLPKQTLYDCGEMLSTWASWADDFGLNWSNPPILYANTYVVGLNAVMAGDGLCMAHDTIAGHLIQTGRLKPVFEHRAKMQEAYYLITAPHLADTPGGEAFVQWMKEEMALDQSGRDGTQA